MVKPELPKLVRSYIKHVLIGFAASAVFVALLLTYNIGNLGHLVSTSSDGVLAVFLLWFFNGLVFAGVQFAVAIMAMKNDDDDHRGGSGGGGHGAGHDFQAVPIPVADSSARRKI